VLNDSFQDKARFSWTFKLALKLTVTGVHSHRGSGARRTAGDESPVDGRRLLGAGFAEAVQVGKQREVDDGEGDISGRRKRGEENPSDWTPD